MPICAFCRNEQTFFFQVTFAEGHVWQNLTLGVFSCTMCQHADVPLSVGAYLTDVAWQRASHGGDVQEFLKVLQGGRVDAFPEELFAEHSKAFRFSVTDASAARLWMDYPTRLTYKPWVLSTPQGAEDVRTLNVVGGLPSPDDEVSIPKYKGHEFQFLMQITDDWEFEPVPGTPPQLYRGCEHWGGPPKDYFLFLANRVCFFGV